MNEEQKRELEELQSRKELSGRIVSPGAERWLHLPINVLDHGFVRLVDYMGDDGAIVQAARVSYGAGTKKVSDDRGLIRYLMRHKHTTPYEMCEVKFHCKMPIFVARQWIRHRTANVNEASARYSILKDEFYFPELEAICLQSTNNRQGRGDQLDTTAAKGVRRNLEKHARSDYELYEMMLEAGVARELARTTLPLSTYTEWYWKVDLHNLLHFLRLRLDKHAQYEIRVFADAMATVVKDWVPLAWEAFEEYVLEAVTFSKSELLILSTLLRETEANPAYTAELLDNLGKRELDEFNQKLDKLKSLSHKQPMLEEAKTGTDA